jgi:hypothetical protein
LILKMVFVVWLAASLARQDFASQAKSSSSSRVESSSVPPRVVVIPTLPAPAYAQPVPVYPYPGPSRVVPSLPAPARRGGLHYTLYSRTRLRVAGSLGLGPVAAPACGLFEYA